MQHPIQTGLVASKLHYKWFRMHLHLVFVCVGQINGPLKNLPQHKVDIMKAQVFAERASSENQRFLYTIILSWACHWFNFDAADTYACQIF